MLESLGLIIILGLILGGLFRKVKLPGFLGYLLAGILLGPYVFNLVDSSILNISSELRQIALIIILLRAGLSIDIKDLVKIGSPAILMCILPAVFEITAIMVLAPLLLGLSVVESGILAGVVSAVSPAVIVPRMLKLKRCNIGTDKRIPSIIMAGSGVDAVFSILIFTTFLGIEMSGNISIFSVMKVPLSLIDGVIVGAVVGLMQTIIYGKIHIRDSIKVIIILAISLLMVVMEKKLSYFPMSSMIAVITMGIVILLKSKTLADRLSIKLSKVWIIAEIILFVLVGTLVDFQYAISSGLIVLAILAVGLVFRSLGVLTSLTKTNLNKKERIFSVVSYLPKATVQASIGGVALSYGLACGNIVLIFSIIAIIITAPLGAILIDKLYPKLLKQQINPECDMQINLVDDEIIPINILE